MSAIAGSAVPIQQESIQSTGPVSEAAISAIGAAANYCLANVMPVGSYIDSDLDETTFQSQTSTSWVLSDGRSIVGSLYASLTGRSNLTDWRGLFGRYKNNGGSALGTRNDGKQNPDGDLAIGTFQANQNASHAHDLVQRGVSTGSGAVVIVDGPAGGGGTGATGTTGGNEARPNCCTTNRFVRIN